MMSSVDLLSLSLEDQLCREWLVTNGAGGYASSTIPSIHTRKYHGLLVAPMAPLVRQMVLLSRVDEFVKSGGRLFPLSSCEYPDTFFPTGHEFLRAFSNDPFPRWAYQADGFTIEKQLRMVPGENTVLLTYTLLGASHGVDLELKPLFALRGIHDLMYQWNGRLSVEGDGKTKPYSRHRIPATNRTPELFFAHDGRFAADQHWYLNTIYRREQERGYPGLEDVWMPGSVWWTLAPGQSVHFACSVDPIDLAYVIGSTEREHSHISLPAVAEAKPDSALEALVRAAGQFIVSKPVDGVSVSGVMAGYPWPPPSGRVAMMGFTGLFLVTGRLAEARSALESFAALEQDGLMPSEFPWDGADPRYQGVDVSLWFIDAVWHYLRYGGDAELVERRLLPVIESIIRRYRDGTALGIEVDADGLLMSREHGTPTTWMDAKAGDWVVTARHGRAVEVNALWYNAQRIAAALLKRAGQEARCNALLAAADQTKAGFNLRFWNEDTASCFDVVDDGLSDSAVRPNQLLALSLAFPVLDLERHAAVLEVARQELLTPFGLRTLSPRHGSYARRYQGGIESRDQAYHQGSVFPWLLGPYVRAMLAVRGRSATVRGEMGQLLKGCIDHLHGSGLGQLCELFDGDPPHRPGGLPACARSVGEILRCYAEDVLDLAPVSDAGSVKAASPSGPVAGRRS